jgi:hypothetical protein
MLRIEAESDLDNLHRLIKPSQLIEGFTAIEVSHALLRIVLTGPVQIGLRLHTETPAKGENSQPGTNLHSFGIEFLSSPETFLGFSVAPQSEVGLSQLGKEKGIFGVLGSSLEELQTLRLRGSGRGSLSWGRPRTPGRLGSSGGSMLFPPSMGTATLVLEDRRRL